MGKGGGGAGPNLEEMMRNQRELAAEQIRMMTAAQKDGEERIRIQRREDAEFERQRLKDSAASEASKAMERGRREANAGAELYSRAPGKANTPAGTPDISAPTIETPDYGSTEVRPL